MSPSRATGTAFYNNSNQIERSSSISRARIDSPRSSTSTRGVFIYLFSLRVNDKLVFHPENIYPECRCLDYFFLRFLSLPCSYRDRKIVFLGSISPCLLFDSLLLTGSPSSPTRNVQTVSSSRWTIFPLPCRITDIRYACRLLPWYNRRYWRFYSRPRYV